MVDLSRHLSEIPEAEAGAGVAKVYDDVRRVTGVSTVALVYRALAIDPGSLGAIWASLAPNLADPQVRAAATQLGTMYSYDVSPIPAKLFSVDRAAAAVTLASFDRVNRLNLVGLLALFEGVSAVPAPEQGASARDTLAGGLAMSNLGSLPPDTIALLEEMSLPVTGGEPPLLVPSLFRYFAHDRALLAALWEAIRPVVTSDAFPVTAVKLLNDARGIAAAFPYTVPRLAAGPARVIVERFVGTIPPMIVVTGLLGEALGRHA